MEYYNIYKKSPANAQQPQCMFEKNSKTKSKSVTRGRQTTRGYSVLLVLTRGRHVSLCQRHIG